MIETTWRRVRTWNSSSAHVPKFPAICGLILATLLAIPSPAAAFLEAVSEDGEYSIEAVGSTRLTGAYLHHRDVEKLFPDRDDGLGAGVFRLILDGDLGTYTNYEVNFFTEASRVPATGLGGTFATAGSFESPYRTPYLLWNFWEDDSATGQMGLDRFFVNLKADPLSITLGRMPINYSVMNIFPTNDFFAPFSVTAINKIYKPGVDALRVCLSPGLLSSVEMVGVLGSDADKSPSWEQTALLVRMSMVQWNFEGALLGGKLAGRWIAGGSIQGEIGAIGLRTEGHVGFPGRQERAWSEELVVNCEKEDDNYVRFSSGLEKPFTWHNLFISAEYMFQSDGAPGPSGYLNRLMCLFPDDLPFMGRHYLGLSAGGDIIPILKVNAMGLLNVEDVSGLASLVFLCSLSDEADLAAGLLLPWGSAPGAGTGMLVRVPDLNSEFGVMPMTVFIETRLYF